MLITIKEAATIAGIQEATFKRKVKNGLAPQPMKTTPEKLWDKEEILTWNTRRVEELEWKTKDYPRTVGWVLRTATLKLENRLGYRRKLTVGWIPLDLIGYDGGLENIGKHTYAFWDAGEPPIEAYIIPGGTACDWEARIESFIGDTQENVAFGEVKTLEELEPGYFCIIEDVED